MSAYDVVISLCKSRGLAQTALEKELGFSRGSIGKMRTSQMTHSRLQKIADYFDVSVEYLTTGREDPQHISREEQHLLDLFRQLNRTGRDMLFAQADLLASSPVYQKGTEKSSASAV